MARGEQKHQESGEATGGGQTWLPAPRRPQAWALACKNPTPNGTEPCTHPGDTSKPLLGAADKGAQAWAAALLVGTHDRACRYFPADAVTVHGWIRL